MLATPLHFSAEKHSQIFIFLMENFKFSNTADITKCLITITLFFTVSGSTLLRENVFIRVLVSPDFLLALEAGEKN